jgi:hypothetical protein
MRSRRSASKGADLCPVGTLPGDALVDVLVHSRWQSIAEMGPKNVSCRGSAAGTALPLPEILAKLRTLIWPGLMQAWLMQAPF